MRVGQALLPVHLRGGQYHTGQTGVSVLLGERTAPNLSAPLGSRLAPHFPYCARACSCCCTCFFSAWISSCVRNIIRATFLVLEYGRINCIEPLCSRMEK